MHPFAFLFGWAAGMFVGHRTKHTNAAMTVGGLVWVALGLLLWGCLVVALLTSPFEVAMLFTCPLFLWLGWKAIWIGIRPSRLPYEVIDTATVAHQQRALGG